MASIHEVMGVNAESRKKATEKLPLHHVEIHPERDEHGKIVKGGGHTVHIVYRNDDYRERKAEKPFGAGEHEEMMDHVRGELNLPESGKEEEEEDE